MDIVSAYLFVKRFIAEATDGELSDSEWELMVQQLADDTRTIGLDHDAWQAAMADVDATYGRLFLKSPAEVVSHFRRCVGYLRATFDDMPQARERVVEQLWQLAAADGHIHWMERHFISQITQAWRPQVASVPRNRRA